MFWADLSSAWRELAAQQRDLGANAQACTLEWCAADLEQRAREWESERLTLDQAAGESGYSRSSFERWLREGEIEDAGSSGSPRIRRRDLPRKPGRGESTSKTEDGLPDVVEEILAGSAV